MPHNKGKTVRKMDRVAKNLSHLETELRHIQRNDHRGRLGPTGHAKNRINKPKGQAGRSELKGGYSLQQAMGLAGNNRKYNAFRMIARRYTNRYLDTEKTLKEQDKLTVTLLLSYAQRKHQFLARFRDNWPFHDFIACYLRNHVQYTKKRHSNVDDLEINDSDLSDGDLDDMLNDDEATLTPTSRRKRLRHAHHSDNSETDEERSPRPQKKLKFAYVSIPTRAKPAPASRAKPAPHAKPAPRTKPAPKSKMTQIPARRLDLPIPTSKSSPATTHPDPLPAAKPKPRPILSSDTCTTKVATETPPTAAAKPKAKPKSIPHKTHAKTKSKPADDNDNDAYEFADLPLVCPNDSCKDLVPADPTIELVKQLRQWNSFKTTNRCMTSEGLRLELEICTALRQLREEKLNMQRAKARGWPTTIIWENISDRVLQMEADLDLMIHDQNTRRYSFFHDMFLEDLSSTGLKSNSTEREFSKLAITSRLRIPAMVTNHARPGYYGEKGKTIIQSAIFSMFDHEQTSNDAFAPLDFKTYIEYYLIPWVAMHLISKDLGCSLEEAYEEMIASADSGVSLHPMADKDSRIERITRHHCVLAAEKRVEKVKRFRNEMKDEIEKAKEEQRMHDELAAKIASKQRAPITSKSQPTAGPSKFPGSYDNAAYQDEGESELSEPPESIQATPVPRSKPSRTQPARRRSRR
ncbi:hypothetical protein DEU56DRAFT_918200 [Suillus clintonianus]|uniref:uncharacterized protein n=1 Tax=Suillus clintonianus TaxID=1904413 RepID=UPI001B884882|nr:uncharacterized protein DEU56DRAFT_918200 [Suillus clintonianus]KAG2121443.1 hypothetical protein DEU56DRAFT_918200 [Suillus clintonianus]